MKPLYIHEPRFIDSNDDIAIDEMTWWVCRRCHVMKMYTTDELRQIKGGIPICAEGYGHASDGLWMQSYFMQRIEFGLK